MGFREFSLSVTADNNPPASQTRRWRIFRNTFARLVHIPQWNHLYRPKQRGWGSKGRKSTCKVQKPANAGSKWWITKRRVPNAGEETKSNKHEDMIEPHDLKQKHKIKTVLIKDMRSEFGESKTNWWTQDNFRHEKKDLTKYGQNKTDSKSEVGHDMTVKGARYCRWFPHMEVGQCGERV